MTLDHPSAEVEGIVASLREAGPIELALTLCHRGRVVAAHGWADADATTLTIPRAAQSGNDLLVFPTALMAHSIARYVGLGPRPQIATDGVLALTRCELDDRERFLAGGGDLPGSVRDALNTPDALRWALTLRGRFPPRADIYSEMIEVYDAHDHGIWLVIPAPVSADEIALMPADSTVVWRTLTTMLPTPEELELLLAAP